MAFENIGIGGVLRFDSRGAVAAMGKAQHGFMGMSKAATIFKGQMGKVGRGLKNFSGMAGTAITGLATLGLGSIVREGINFNKEMENARISIAGILSVLEKTPISENIDEANKALSEMDRIAAQAPGELQDTMNIFKQLIGPMKAAGGNMDEILTATQGAQIAAGMLGFDYRDAGKALAKMQAGTLEMGNDFILILKSTGLIKETTQEWKALLPEQRLKRMSEILGDFQKSSAAVGATYDALGGTLRSMRKTVSAGLMVGVFKELQKRFSSLSDAFFKNKDAVTEWSTAMGEKIGAAFAFLIDTAIDFGRTVRSIFNWLGAKVSYVTDQLAELGIVVDNDILKKVAKIGVAFTGAFIMVSPLITVVGFLVAKLSALWSIVHGFLGLFQWALILPLLKIAAIVGAIYLLFREEGETPMETLGRALVELRNLADQLYAAIQPIIDAIKTAFTSLMNTAKKFWEGIQPGVERLRDAARRIIRLFVRMVEIIAPIVAKVIKGIAAMIEALRPGLEAIFNAAARVVQVIVSIAEAILPRLMALLEPIINGIVMIGQKLAELFSAIWEILGPVIEAIAGLVESVLLPALMWLWDVFAPIFQAAFEIIFAIIGGILDTITWLLEGLKTVGEYVGGAFKWVWEQLGAAFEWVGGIINDYIIEPIKYVTGLISDFINMVGDALSAVGDFVGGAISAVGDGVSWVGGKASDAIGAVGGAASDAWDWITGSEEELVRFGDMYSDIADKIYEMEAAQRMATMSTEELQAASQKALEYILQLWTQVRDYALGVINDVASFFKATPKIDAEVKETQKVNVAVNTKAELCIDGKRVGTATSKYQQEIQERSGFNNQPWQKRCVQITGMTGSTRGAAG